MVKHIVMWKLKNKADSEIIRDKLNDLMGKIPGLLNIEVGIDFSDNDADFHMVLVAELENKEALEAYRIHPDHQAVIPLVQTACIDRAVVDYEI
ncbi:MAG: Dabb family protein [Mariprofundaceae bacterium]|nr:Dabb family protein [Mariprofundaceae bacterium]